MDRPFGNVTVVLGDKNGKYPQGNSLLIRGSERTAIIDPSMAVVERAEEFRDTADLVVLSHVHEDHVAGVHLFPRAEIWAHQEDVLGIRSLAGLSTIYGDFMPLDGLEAWLVGSFHYAARPDALGYEEGKVFDLGGSTIRPIHLPGHTRGHCVLLIEPENILFLGDIDLTGFGPYYGDAWSSLADFETSMRKLATIPATRWVSFHHVGIVEDDAVFREKLSRFARRIEERDVAMAEFLSEPRRIDEMVRHRFLYPPHADMPFIDAVEKRTIEQHMERGIERGWVVCEDGRYRCVGDPGVRAEPAPSAASVPQASSDPR